MKKVRSKLYPTTIGVIKTFSLSPDDEIGEIAVECTGCTYYYNNLAELCEKWEDYEEPKKWYTINKFNGSVQEINDDSCAWTDKEKESIAELGFKFETKEEAEKAVEKLKAWKRLKDKGFMFGEWENDEEHYLGDFIIHSEIKHSDNITDDLDLLFGGEE